MQVPGSEAEYLMPLMLQNAVVWRRILRFVRIWLVRDWARVEKVAFFEGRI